MPFFTDAVPPEAWAPFAPLFDAVLDEAGSLDRALKEAILFAAAALGTAATGRNAAEATLLAFCRKLALEPAAFGKGDFEPLRAAGFSDAQILEAILAAGCGSLVAVLERGYGRAPRSPALPAAAAAPPEERRGPHLAADEKTPAEVPAFAVLQKQFGFVPKLYRAQTLAPRAIEAEAGVLDALLFGPTSLSRAQKEALLVAAAAANRDTYGVTLHARALQLTGVSPEAADRIAAEPGSAELPEADRALLEAAQALSARPGALPDLEALGRRGCSREQVEEAIGLSALAGFLGTVRAGLGVPPDFRPRRDYLAEPPVAANLSGTPPRPTGDDRRPSAPADDPDGPFVARAREGDMSAFEALVRRHQGRVYRTLLGITGNAEDAQDGAQSVFLKVFRKLADFGGDSLFSTWLHRIAVNEGLERLRSRRPTESLEAEEEEEFRPSRLQPWVEDPESLCARAEMKRIVEEALGRLPAAYRTALLLRDIQQLSGAEAAAVLGIPLPTLKTRLLRGRLMLREALAGRFTAALPAARA